MWETISAWEGWDNVGAAGIWLVTLCLLVIGFAGCFIPILPGHLIILMAAVFHRLVLGGEQSGVDIWTFVVLILLLAASQVFEIISGAVGSRWFGGTKSGAVGAIFGALFGMLFMPLGLIIGPLLGAYAFEIAFGRQNAKKAAASGLGSAVGTLISLVVKVLVGVLMIAWFLVDALLVN